MKNAFFLIFLALGMFVGVATYAVGGVFLMATGLMLCFILFTSLFMMGLQVRRLLSSFDPAPGEFALPA